MSDRLLEIKDLHTNIELEDKTIYAVNGVSFSVDKNEIVAIIGESGCGKSMTATSIMRLIRDNNISVNGKVLFNGENLLDKTEKEMRDIRGNKISMIYQEPMSALNPYIPIGYQIKEVLTIHKIAKGKQAKKMAIDILKQVEIPEPEKRYKAYPHELSGGMQQRVLIGMAIISHPELLIADEPTTALDVSIQAEIIRLLKKLKELIGMSILFISHDLGLVSSFADRIMIMYGGKIMEIMNADNLSESLHPYTRALIKCVPKINENQERLFSIDGHVIDLSEVTNGCKFYDRCDIRTEKCLKEQPPFFEKIPNHYVRCWLYENK